MYSLAVGPATAGPWWGSPAIALIGIVLGFALKAVFDTLVEKQRHAREDHLRFLAEKTHIYAEFGFLCSRIENLWGKVADWEERRARLETRVNALQEAYPDGASSDDVPEITNLREDLDAIIASKAEMRATADEYVREMNRLANLIALLAPEPIRASSGALVHLLTDENDLDPELYESARSQFFAAARADLGIPLDGHLGQLEESSAWWQRFSFQYSGPPAI